MTTTSGTALSRQPAHRRTENRAVRQRIGPAGAALGAVACTALSAACGGAFAQTTEPTAPLSFRTDYLGYSLSGSARAGYSDNINLASSPNEDGEAILSTLFTGGAIVSTPLVTGVLIGDLDLSYLVDQSDVLVSQNVGAVSTFTALDNWFYLDISGSSRRQVVGDNARFSGNINAGRQQQVNVHSYTASPYVYHRFADLSSIEARYRFSQSLVDDSNQNFNPFGGAAFNDTLAQEATLQYDSGGAFNRARFRLAAYGADVTEDSQDFVILTADGPTLFSEFEFQQGSVFSDIQILLNDVLSLSGAIGYDEVDTGEAASLFFDDTDLSGVFWRAGFTAAPGRRANIRVEYGERYGDDFVNADIQYRISSRLNFSARAERSFRTRTQSVSSQFRGNARATLDFADRLREGEELSPRAVVDAANFFSNGGNNVSLAQTSGVAISDTASASLVGRFGRTSISMQALYSDDDFGFRQTEVYGAGVSVQRRLSRRLTAYGDLSYRYADTTVDTTTCEATPAVFGLETPDDCGALAANNGVTDNVTGRIGGSYRLYRNASVFAEYSRTERFADIDSLEFSENVVFAGITLDF